MAITFRVFVVEKLGTNEQRTLLIERDTLEADDSPDDFIVKTREKIVDDLGECVVECETLDQEIAMSCVFEQTL